MIRLIQDIKFSATKEKWKLGFDSLTLSQFESNFFRILGIQFSYGQREILLKAMNENFNKAFQVVLQHGAYTPSAVIEYGVAYTSKRNLKSRYRFVSFSKHDEDKVRDYGIKDVVSIGAPWLYLDAAPGTVTSNTIGFFPAHHSSHYNYPGSTVSAIRQRINLVKSQFPGMQITVFLYFSEFLMREWHEASESAGFDLFCAGLPNNEPVFAPHPSRISFLPQLKKKLSEMELCAFESYSTAILYAGSLGKTAALIKTPVSEFRIKEDPLEEIMLNDVFRPGKNSQFVDGHYLKDFSLRCLGQEQVKNVEQLFAILEPMRLPSLESLYGSS